MNCWLHPKGKRTIGRPATVWTGMGIRCCATPMGAPGAKQAAASNQKGLILAPRMPGDRPKPELAPCIGLTAAPSLAKLNELTNLDKTTYLLKLKRKSWPWPKPERHRKNC